MTSPPSQAPATRPAEWPIDSRVRIVSISELPDKKYEGKTAFEVNSA
jgi:hypothetical protein